MIDGSVLQSAQRCLENKSRVVVKMVVRSVYVSFGAHFVFQEKRFSNKTLFKTRALSGCIRKKVGAYFSFEKKNALFSFSYVGTDKE